MTYREPKQESPVNWTLVISLVVLFTLALTVAIVFAVNAIQSSSSNAGTDVAKRIEAPQHQANYASVQVDVTNAVLAVQTAGAQDPTASAASVPLTASNAQTQLVAAGSVAGGFTITGTYVPTGYQYQYSSATGKFAVVNAGTDLSTPGATR